MIHSTARLRTIALTVQEIELGAFGWLLLESNLQGEWIELSAATLTSKTYAVALAEGLLVLQGLALNLDLGPREAPAGRSKGGASRGVLGLGHL